MKPLKQTFIHILLTLVVVVLSQKSTDESRPYEFGFTIDGEQHRHEKKDQNGIVQGEFGFITADGVYHVTVYATDENGKFKILSMRNIRISAPLDGSPATGPISPEAGKYLGKQKQIGNSLVSPPGLQSPQQSQQPPKQYPQSSGTNSQPNQQISPQSPQGPLPLSITTKPKLYEFTTQATIKPACGGCGYVTTSKPINGQPFAFQNPAFQNLPNGLNSPSSSNSEQKPQNLQSGSPGSLQPPVGSQYQQQSDPHRQNVLDQLQSNPQNTQAGSNLGQSPGALPVNPQQNIANQQNNLQYPSAGPPQQGTFKQNPQSRGNLLQPLDANFLPPGTSQDVNGQQQVIQGHNGNVPTSDDFALFGNRNAGSNGRIPFPATSSSEVQPNPLSHQNKDVAKLPPVSVTGNSIHVAGSKPVDIPIRDKYPGMVDGLPDGIEEKDIKDILYKFHYTVGFHGHYEKGLKNGAKIGGYFVNGRDGISRVVTYIADENGYRPKFKFINLGLDSSDTPKEGTEKSFGLKSFEFVWYPVE